MRTIICGGKSKRQILLSIVALSAVIVGNVNATDQRFQAAIDMVDSFINTHKTLPLYKRENLEEMTNSNNAIIVELARYALTLDTMKALYSEQIARLTGIVISLQYQDEQLHMIWANFHDQENTPLYHPSPFSRFKLWFDSLSLFGTPQADTVRPVTFQPVPLAQEVPADVGQAVAQEGNADVEEALAQAGVPAVGETGQQAQDDPVAPPPMAEVPLVDTEEPQVGPDAQMEEVDDCGYSDGSTDGEASDEETLNPETISMDQDREVLFDDNCIPTTIIVNGEGMQVEVTQREPGVFQEQDTTIYISPFLSPETKTGTIQSLSERGYGHYTRTPKGWIIANLGSPTSYSTFPDRASIPE
ncbi:MAG: hypothetical protein LBJ92_03335 [Holosporales bacterium]|jgi:hypothetical protein|nr:hypothetical protein [Holosporales bacterium]